jgi:hypothetical protein
MPMAARACGNMATPTHQNAKQQHQAYPGEEGTLSQDVRGQPEQQYASQSQ